MKAVKLMMAGLMAAAAMSAVCAASSEYDEWDKNYTIQALLGGVQYDDLVFSTSTVSNDTTTIDMSTLPQLGGAWSTKPKGDKNLSFGLETTFLLGFKFDDVNTYSGANSVYITASSYLLMVDWSGGAYANLMLGKKLRLYGGAGPLIMLSYYNSKHEYTDARFNSSASDTAFGLGAYVRAGLELQVQPQGYLGVGARGNYSNIDFTDVGGSSEISGIAAFITYTAGL